MLPESDNFKQAMDVILNQVMHPYQRVDILSEARFRWNCWSRQTGKSFGKSFRRLMRGMARKRDQLFLSASERQSAELMTKAHMHVKNLKLACDFEEATWGYFEGVELKRLSINIPSVGIRIIGLPANPDTARGFSGDVLLDEFGMHKNEREIWAAMYPSILRERGELDVISTPPITGRKHLFYALKANPRWSTQVVTIDEAVAQGLVVGDPVELKEAMTDDLRYRREFLCEFLDAEGALLALETICTCEDDKLPRELDIAALRELRNVDLFGGVDVARKGHLTVIWVFQLIGRMLISRGMLELRNTKFRKQFKILSDLMRVPGMRKLAIDSNGVGMQLSEDLAEDFGATRVEQVAFTHPMKAQMAGQMVVKFDDRNIRIPACELIRNDLNSVEKIVSKAGNVLLQAPEEDGSHADRFWAAALAIHAAGSDLGPVEAIFGDPFEERQTW